MVEVVVVCPSLSLSLSLFSLFSLFLSAFFFFESWVRTSHLFYGQCNVVAWAPVGFQAGSTRTQRSTTKHSRDRTEEKRRKKPESPSINVLSFSLSPALSLSCSLCLSSVSWVVRTQAGFPFVLKKFCELNDISELNERSERYHFISTKTHHVHETAPDLAARCNLNLELHLS